MNAHEKNEFEQVVHLQPRFFFVAFVSFRAFS